MEIALRTMTEEEFSVFRRWSLQNQCAELMEEEHLSPEEAGKEAEAELAQMLPEGLATENQFLKVILRAEDSEPVGWIWTLREQADGILQSFLCDFVIFPFFRRRGYGMLSLLAMEAEARAAGCRESVLFVKNSNRAASALYDRGGYALLRPHSYGSFRKKAL